jgi:hypothetical protein
MADLEGEAAMTNQNEDKEGEAEIHVDEDWKRAVADEKEKLRDEEPAARQAEEAQAEERAPLAEPTMQAFMAGLYTQTLMALGELKNPITGEQKTSIGEAAFLIDTIAMLQKKTEGNLTPEENSYVQNVLTDLRMRYVNAAKQTEEEKGKQAQAE